MYDTKANFVFARVTVAPSPSTSGTTIGVSNADAALFPDPQASGNQAYNPTVWPANQTPFSTNAEVIRVTTKGAVDSAGTGNTQLTFARTAEQNLAGSMTARSIQVGDWIALNITKKWFDDIEKNKLELVTVAPVGTPATYTTTGTADQTPINNAITAVNAAGGGIVRLKAGTYTVNGSISLLSNVVLEGEGRGATTIKIANGVNSASMHVIQGNTISNAVIRNLQIDGNKSNQTNGGHAIRLDNGCTNIDLNNLYIHDMYLHGIIMKETTSVYHYNISIDKCWIANCGTSANGSGIYFGNTIGMHISNIFSTGHQLDGVQWKTSENVQLTNIHTYNNSRYGVYAVAGHFNITNLTSYSNNMGVNLEYDGTNLLNTTGNLDNLNIYSNTADGIRIADCSYVSIANAKVYNNGTATSAAGLKLTASTGNSVTYVRVSNSSFFDTQGTPTQTYGIWGTGSGTVDHNLINGVQLFGNSTTNLRTDTWGSDNSVINVFGFNRMGGLSIGNIGATKTFDRANADYQIATLTANLTITLTAGKQRGDFLTLQLQQDATGNRTVTWPSNFKPAGGVITHSISANAADVVTMRWDGSAWREVGRNIQDYELVSSGRSYSDPSWIASLAGSKITGVIAVTNGGTGASSLTGILKGNGTSAITGSAILNDLGSPTSSFSMNSQKITNLLDPTSAQDAATKSYVDAVKTGLDVKDSVRVATTAALATNTRSGNILTASANGALASIDGVSLSLNDRLLVKDEATGANNGIYTVSSLGSVSTPWTLTRTTDADTSAEVTAGMYTFVTEGTANADSGWTLTTNDPITLNTTALSFVQFSGAGQITAGTGLSKSGNTLSLTTPVALANGGTGASTLSDQGVPFISSSVFATDATSLWYDFVNGDV